jgi:hypothetical protein
MYSVPASKLSFKSPLSFASPALATAIFVSVGIGFCVFMPFRAMSFICVRVSAIFHTVLAVLVPRPPAQVLQYIMGWDIVCMKPLHPVGTGADKCLKHQPMNIPDTTLYIYRQMARLDVGNQLQFHAFAECQEGFP